MTNSSLHVSRRRLLASIVTIGGASAASGAGTMAFFSDSETSSDNTIQAGTLNLTTDGDEEEATFLDKDEIKPGDSGEQSVTLGNAGSVPGSLLIDLDGWRDYENERLGVEEQRNIDNTDEEGELQEYLKVRLLIGGTPKTDWEYVANLPQNHTLDLDVDIPPTESREITIEWHFEEPDTGNANDAQSDRVEIDLLFRLVQSGGG